MKKIALTLALLALPATSAFAQADGKALYTACAACHQATGLGIPGAFPPLAESEWVNGPVENLIRIQLRGLMGPIKVKGADFNSMMPAQAQQSDEDIAAVLTYVRSNFGNKSGPVTPDQVKALRSEVGKPPLKVEDLKDPNEVEVKPAGPTKLESGKTTKIDHPSSPNYLIIGGGLIWIGICSVIGFIGIGRGK